MIHNEESSSITWLAVATFTIYTARRAIRDERLNICHDTLTVGWALLPAHPWFFHTPSDLFSPWLLDVYFSFWFCQICFTFLKALLLGAYTFRVVICSWLTDSFIIINYPLKKSGDTPWIPQISVSVSSSQGDGRPLLGLSLPVLQAENCLWAVCRGNQCSFHSFSFS